MFECTQSNGPDAVVARVCASHSLPTRASARAFAPHPRSAAQIALRATRLLAWTHAAAPPPLTARLARAKKAAKGCGLEPCRCAGALPEGRARAKFASRMSAADRPLLLPARSRDLPCVCQHDAGFHARHLLCIFGENPKKAGLGLIENSVTDTVIYIYTSRH
jgi:hypothetical protein